jgi:DNA-binding Xre family transcriptional regulator
MKLIKINFRQVAMSRGIKTAYELQARCGLAPSTAARFFRNDPKHLTIESLSKLVEGLNCEIGELLVRPPRASKRKTKG